MLIMRRFSTRDRVTGKNGNGRSNGSREKKKGVRLDAQGFYVILRRQSRRFWLKPDDELLVTMTAVEGGKKKDISGMTSQAELGDGRWIEGNVPVLRSSLSMFVTPKNRMNFLVRIPVEHVLHNTVRVSRILKVKNPDDGRSVLDLMAQKAATQAWLRDARASTS